MLLQMNFLLIPIAFFLIFLNPLTSSAHIYLNDTSIPAFFIPKKTSWDSFNNLTGCHKGSKAHGVRNLKKYFKYFGYLNNSYRNLSNRFDADLESAVKTYQLNFKLNSTGELDQQTLNHIVQLRCGNPDVVNGTSSMFSGRPENGSIVTRYSFYPNVTRWPRGKTQLTYAFLPENRLSGTVRGVFARAFQRWTNVTRLTFRETSSYPRLDIRIAFYNGSHGDREPFNGILGTLAHVFEPPIGRFHLDGQENWVLDGVFHNNTTNNESSTAIDLESVVVHEIGHLLGLGHSSDENVIMYPSILPGTRKVELVNNDRAGVQELYGVRSDPNPNPRGPGRNTSRANKSGSPTPMLLFIMVGIFSLLQ